MHSIDLASFLVSKLLLKNSLTTRNFEQVYFWKISFKFYVTLFIKPFNRENKKQTNPQIESKPEKSTLLTYFFERSQNNSTVPE